jgi:tetratricopeptide (TPR) repeat protein
VEEEEEGGLLCPVPWILFSVLGLAALLFAANFGVAHLGLALAVVGCGVPPVLAIGTDWRAGGVSPLLKRRGTNRGLTPPARQWSPGMLALQLVVAAVTLFVLVNGELCPLLASYASRSGEPTAAVDLKTALEWHETAIDQDGGRVLLHLRRAAVLHQAARTSPDEKRYRSLLEQSRQELDEACRLTPNDADAQAGRARLLGEMVGAGLVAPSAPLRAWEETLLLEPNHPRLLAEAGRAMLCLGQPERARLVLQHGLDLHPHRAALHAGLGACEFADGRLDAAAHCLETALDAEWLGDDEGRTHAFATLAAVYLAQGRFDLAEKMARQASVRQPDWPTAFVLLAQALQGLGKTAEARAQYDWARSLDAHSVGHRATGL